MKTFNSILLVLSLMFLQGCGYMKTDETTDPYSITHKEVKNMYNETFLSTENISDYYEFIIDCQYNENTGCFQYTGQLRPKFDIYTCMDSEEIQISYTYQKNTYNCTYDAVTGEITNMGRPISSQTVSETEYLDPYFSMSPGIISADYIICLEKDAAADENSRYQKIQLTFNENIDITDCKGTLCFFIINDELPWLYTHKAHDAFYGQGNYRFLQIEAKGGYCTLLFPKDNRRNVSARYFFEDGTSSGSLSAKDILNESYYGSLITESGEKYILE